MLQSSDSDSIIVRDGLGYFAEEYHLGYQDTVMFGHFNKIELPKMYKQQVKQLRKETKKIKRKQRRREGPKLLGSRKIGKLVYWIWHSTLFPSDDWGFLFALGVLTAILSFTVSESVIHLNHARISLFYSLGGYAKTQYFVWVTVPIIIMICTAQFVHKLAPQAIGSGIPEMKTILRGIHLHHYLTTNALIAKSVGLVGVLSSGMPVGKEGPFVHMAGIIATKLIKLAPKQKGIYENESRHYDKLSAASAVGVASCYGTPVGGVLFSIEVTALFFAVRNYWRAFFSATICSLFVRLFFAWFSERNTLTSIFQTFIHAPVPFEIDELLIFGVLGFCCGVGGALYVWVHRRYVIFIRARIRIKSFMYRFRLIYPVVVVFVISSITCPLTLGKWISGDIPSAGHIHCLFLNFSYFENITIEQKNDLKPFIAHAGQPYIIFMTLISFTIFTFIFSIIAGTLPVPSGSFIPGFKIGAALGRLVGELTYLTIRNKQHPVTPAGYAIAGAAAFAGAITHSFSVSVMMIEITGQITHIIPTLLAIIVSNTTAICLQPSLYNSIIKLKRLPHVPEVNATTRQRMLNIYVEDFMVKNVIFIWKGITYREVKDILNTYKLLHSFPVVDAPDTRVLLGSVHRDELTKIVDFRVSRKARLKAVADREKKMRQSIIRTEQRLRNKQFKNRFQVTPVTTDQASGSHTSSEHELLEASASKRVFTPGVYATVTGTESHDEESAARIRTAIEAIKTVRRGTGENLSETPIPETDLVTYLVSDSDLSLTTAGKDTSVPILADITTFKKDVDWSFIGDEEITKGLHKTHVRDMTLDEIREWEAEQLKVPVDFSIVRVDPAPFQLVDRTSLEKVHSLFGIIGIYHAYVTRIGQLIGVVALRELSKAITDVISGKLQPKRDSDNETDNAV